MSIQLTSAPKVRLHYAISSCHQKLLKPKNCILSTSIVDKLSADDLSKLDFDSDFCFFFLNLGIEMPPVIPPVIKFEVDLDSSFISDIVEISMTDCDNFFGADSVKLLLRTLRAASVSNCSFSTIGQIYKFC